MKALPSRVIVPLPVQETIRASAQAAYPLECCGLLIGRTGTDAVVTEAVAVPNIADSPRRRFAIDPQCHFDLLRELRGSDRTVIGHFHSHPDGEPRPSVHDLDMAFDAAAVWLVVATGEAGAGETKAYICPDQSVGFVELPLLGC